jgi:23S rRNA (uracil1939-C5)-methyltransferase
MWKRKNKIIENVKIEKVWFWWIGIAHNQDWKTILVSWWVLPWMIVDVKILKKKSDFIKAQAIKINSWNIELKADKICKHHFVYDTNLFTNTENHKAEKVWCWWCKWQILPYEEQIKLKEQVVKDSFNWTNFFEKSYEWIIPSERIFNYRNKMEFSFWKYIAKEKEYSHWSLGFHKQWQFSKIVDIDSCLIADNKINEVFAYLKKIIKNSNLPVYDQFNHTGFFRHLVIRQGSNTGQVLVNLVIASKYLEKNKWEINKWQKLQDQLMQDSYLKENINTFIITENNWLADVVKWQDIKTIPLWWPWYIFDKLIIDNQEITFRISAFSFFQTNTYQAQNLFKTAKNLLPKIKWNILDLYCGAGTIGISLNKLWIWENLLGVEIVEDAVKDAYKNAEINWLKNTKFIADKAENINFEAENIGLVVIDPPRSWLHPNVVNFLINLKEKFNFPLLYISCNPVTMARDLKMLEKWWWSIKKLKAVDMFPHTHHIEMIWLLK